MTTTTVGTREDALLWLNDRLGQEVSATVTLHRGDTSATLLTVEGELRHWREVEPLAAGRAGGLAHLAGSYEVGGASLDLTHVREPVAVRDEHRLIVVLAEHEHGADYGDELGLVRVTLEIDDR